MLWPEVGVDPLGSTLLSLKLPGLAGEPVSSSLGTVSSRHQLFTLLDPRLPVYLQRRCLLVWQREAGVGESWPGLRNPQLRCPLTK